MFTQMVEIDKYLIENKLGRVAHSVHDESVSCVPKSEGQHVANIQEEFMRQSPIWLPELPLDAESAIAKQYEKP